MFLLFISIFLFVILFASCNHKNSKQENIIPTYSKVEVLELIGAENLNCKIIDIKYQSGVDDENYEYTSIFMELKVDDEEFLKNNYFNTEQYELPPLIKKEFTNNGIIIDSNTEIGVNFKEYVLKRKNEVEHWPYSIYWVKSNQNPQNNSNVAIYADIPVVISIEK